MKLSDEMRYAGPEHLDPDYVATYEDKARNDPTDDIKHLEDLGLGAESTVLDLGAGTGIFAAAVAPLCQKVIAVDVSPAMISVITSKVEKLGLENVEVVRAGFLSFEAPAGSIDFVYSRHALHQIPDNLKEIALVAICKLLKPLGVLYIRDLIFSFPRSEADRYLKPWLDAAPADPRDGWTREELETHLTTEFSPYSVDLETMLDRAGFKIREVTHSDNKIFSTYTCIKKPHARA